MYKAFSSRNIVVMSSVVVEVARQVGESAATPWWISQKVAWEEQIQEAQTSSELQSNVDKLVTQAVDWAVFGSLLQSSFQETDCIEAPALEIAQSITSTEPLDQQEQVALSNGISGTSSEYREEAEDGAHNEIECTGMMRDASSTSATLICVENRQAQFIPTVEETLLGEGQYESTFQGNRSLGFEKKKYGCAQPTKEDFLGLEACVAEIRVDAPELPVHPVSSFVDSAQPQEMKDQDQSKQTHMVFAKEQDSHAEIGESSADMAKALQIKDQDQFRQTHILFAKEQGSQVNMGESFADVAQAQHMKDGDQSTQSHMYSAKGQGSQVEVGGSFAVIGQAQQMKDQDQSSESHMYSANEQRTSQVDIGESFADVAQAQQMKDQGQSSESHMYSAKEQGTSQVEIGESGADIVQVQQTEEQDRSSQRQMLSAMMKGLQVEIGESFSYIAQTQQTKEQDQSSQSHMFSAKEQGSQVEIGESFSYIAQTQQMKDQDQSSHSHMLSANEQGSQVEIGESSSYIAQSQQMKDQAQSMQTHMRPSMEQGSLTEMRELFADIAQAQQMKDQHQSSHSHMLSEESFADIAEPQQVKDQDQSSESHMLSAKNGSQAEIGESLCYITQAQQMKCQSQSMQSHMLCVTEQGSQVQMGKSFAYIGQARSSYNQSSQLEIGESFVDIAQVQQTKDQDESRENQDSQVQIGEFFADTAQVQQMKDQDQSNDSHMLSEESSANIAQLQQTNEDQSSQSCALSVKEQGLEMRESLADIVPAQQMKDQDQSRQSHLVSGELCADIAQAQQMKDQDQSKQSDMLSGDLFADIPQGQQMKDQAQSMPSKMLSAKEQCSHVETGETGESFVDITQGQQVKHQDQLRQSHMLSAREQGSQAEIEFCGREENVLQCANEAFESALANYLTESKFQKKFPGSSQQITLFDSMKAKYAQDDDYMQVYVFMQKDKRRLSAARTCVSKYSRYSILDGFLYFNKRLCVVKDDSIRISLIRQYHTSAGPKHLNAESTVNKLKYAFFWPNVRSHVQKYVRSCTVCHKIKNVSIQQEKPSPAFAPLMNPWERVITKLIHGVPVSLQGHDCIFVIVDIMSKQAHFVACKKNSSVEEISQLYFWEVVRLHGIPRVFVADDAIVFKSEFWRSLWESFGATIELDFSHCEKDYDLKTLEDLIKSYTNSQQQHWQTNLHLFEFMYNNSGFPSSGISPFKALYGHDLCLPSPSLFAANANDEMSEFVTNIAKFLHVVQSTHVSSSKKYWKSVDTTQDPQVLQAGNGEVLEMKSKMLPAAYPNTRKRKFGDRP
ncbi:hypothetical protein O6H91_15G012600 [Diphasiastrum complanatum]|nr:hypothetical protein O6H91_15G012600 [Diphasiastrum complanatum]KAJ7528659.1 hypothetical protein O6H91_15G012600 [Diphasiastrum complanatum]KAJ7528660.1 hypothetical protein O6H91_15G012600 [Diphasiastrum complanatum]